MNGAELPMVEWNGAERRVKVKQSGTTDERERNANGPTYERKLNGPGPVHWLLWRLAVLYYYLLCGTMDLHVLHDCEI